MKICHIAHGYLPIPCEGWGAVEELVWNYKFYCEKLGHEFLIINTKNKNEIITNVNNYKPDVTHIHFEQYYDLIPSLNNKIKVITTHDGGFFKCQPHLEENQQRYFEAFKNGNFPIICLSDKMENKFLDIGIEKKRLIIIKNGSRTDLIKFNEIPIFNKSIYLGMVCPRKRQFLLANKQNIDIIGPISSQSKDINYSNYKGSWTRTDVFNNLTNYSNLVLLSESEAAPLVVCEALIAGLGIVISEACTANLDLSLPFITVIPEYQINNTLYIENKIKENREISIKERKNIREYGLREFDLEKIIKEYCIILQELL